MNSLIGTKEAAKRLNVSVRRVQALIAAGRLRAEKIGNSFAINENDLKMLNGRKNGRPTTPHKRTKEDWKAVLDRIFGSLPANSKKLSRKNKDKKAYDSKQTITPSVSERTQEEWDAIIDNIAGCVSLGPPDLSTNKKYMEGFGREKMFRG